ncbi:DUF4247 domain-containing protein [Brevibacillus laterosporus]|uniref:DUF4247 domain-containing protein n=1 Tax=Brevibacillus laterosporus TaxID=1465 RepID=UPI003D220916
MWQALSKFLKTTLVLSLVAGLLTGCADQSVGSSYPLEKITKNGAESSRIYRATDKTVPEVAKELAEKRQPKEISKEDLEHMFLIYSDEWYHLQKDEAKPSDTLIEVDSKEFVQKNYNMSFLEGYFLASVLGDLFDSIKYKGQGNYRGYSSRDIYKSGTDYHTPSKEEKKTFAPITTEGKGSILRRSSDNSGKSSSSDDSIFKKSDADTTKSKGKITRDSKSDSGGSSWFGGSSSSKKDSSMFDRPRTNSPPKVKKGFGSIKRRR